MYMTWSERIKLAWTTFKREALPLYGWTLIFIGVSVFLVVAMVIGVLAQLHWSFPQAYSGSFSPGMPVPGVPPNPGLNPYAGPFGSPNQNPFGGPMSNFPNLLLAVESLAGTFSLVLIVSWLIGSAFYTGLFNLTAKAYREKATFKDFSFTGFFRILGWQGLLLLIELLLLIIGLVGAFTLGHSQVALWAFLIIYTLLITGVTIFVLPWLTTSSIYLLAHRKEGFWDALSGSWRFFRNHMGILWGYIGTVILIEIAIQVLSKISQGVAELAILVVSPFIAVLAIVWVLSLEEDERKKDVAREINSTTYSAVPYHEEQAPFVNPTASDSLAIDLPSSVHHIPEVTAPEFEGPKIELQKEAPLLLLPEDTPNYCPSCGKANTGTAYCPQCGIKL
jgi:hypothetical protein